MRRIPLIAAALSLLISGPCFAQEWIEYASQKDFFTVNFPSEPKVEDITYTTEYRITLPGRVYSATDGPNRYTVTVVDYTGAEKIHAERNKQCKATDAYPDICGDRSRGDLRGAIVWATFDLRQRDAKVTFYAGYNADLVEGHQLQLTNADGSRTFAAIHMHENRLYIFEGTVPKGAPQPALFQQSLGFIDKEGKRIRYTTTYSNAYPAPPRLPR
ncbi:MAG: hypothetical protein DMG14_12655 [Acidobacteria bacterium]|nr:MAG: hypothetical protein DMG14_12655 [Acidobacteriota bacterium]